jgi:hypothetical protein
MLSPYLILHISQTEDKDFHILITKLNSVNLLKPTGHVMHQHFNIQQL